MTGQRCLIVNGDDFGQSPGTNEGIIAAHERGIVTSASLMVRWPGALEAAAYARQRPHLSVGLHIDLGEWAWVEGEWRTRYEVVPTSDPGAVRDELDRQLWTFCRLMGRGPTHLDSHQHVHRHEPCHSLVIALGRSLNVPVRHYAPQVRYCGDFYGQTARGDSLPGAIGVETLISLLDALPPGVTELACHPASKADLDSTYLTARMQEVRTLCDLRARPS